MKSTYGYAALVASLLVFLYFPAQAQQRSNKPVSKAVRTDQATWPNEPKSFWGVAFGQPIAASVPECPKQVDLGFPEYTIDLSLDAKVCYQQYPALLKLANVSAFPTVYVLDIDGKVEGFSGSRKAIYNEETVKALVEKFGSPTEEKTETVHTRAGVPYTNHIYTWQGASVTLRFETVGSNVTEGDLWVSTKRFDDHANAEKSKNTKGLAGSF